MASPPQFSLTLLGGFSLTRDGQVCHLAYEKGRALLAFLATEPNRSCSRARLAQLFWPHLSRDTALTNLRQVLLDLRKALDTGDTETSPLQVDRQAVRLLSGGNFRVDVAEALGAPSSCPASTHSAQCDPCLHQMEEAAARYRGEFLASFALPDCPEFDEWLSTQREALHLSALNRLIRLSDCLERMGDFGKAAPFALRALELEPWNEQVLIRAMRLLIRTGQDAAALAAYDRCTRTLQRELGVQPTPETSYLADQIRRGDMAQALTASPPVLPAASPSATWTRRQLTVLCMELVPPQSGDIDQLHFLLTQPRARCAEVIQAYGGHLVSVHGRTQLGYFGYPQASEHAARQAVQAGLALVRSPFVDVQVRVGIHTSEVISGGAPASPDLTGELTETAMGLRQLARPGKVLISGQTFRLVSTAFDCPDHGKELLPGSNQTIDTYLVQDESLLGVRLDTFSHTLTPLTGRSDEVAILLASWQSVRRGKHQAILITGEPGIGKSRLLLPLKEALDPHASILIDLRCSPESQHSPYFPLVTWIQQRLGFLREDSSTVRFQKLVRYVNAAFNDGAAEAIPLLANLLGLPLHAPYLATQGSQPMQREPLRRLLLERLRLLANRHPLLLIVEDLHWADPSTLELIEQLLAEADAPRVLAVFTTRPEFEPAWPADGIRRIVLPALDDTQTGILIRHIAPDLEQATLQKVITRSDGIPLYAEELAHQLAHDGSVDIPPTLEDLLMSRLDGLGEARPVAQMAATIGREFDLPLLAHLCQLDDTSLRNRLSRLQAAGMIAALPDERFRFRHVLFRDSAYRSQPRREREASHRTIAQQLQSGSGQNTRPEILAQHWAASGDPRQAVRCWLQAGQSASAQSAGLEALQHFRAGLALVTALPDDSERAQLELALFIGLGATACATQGYASLEGSEAYARAVALSERHQDNTDMFPGFWGLWASASSRVGHGHALTVARRLIRTAEQTGNPIYLQQAHFATGNTLFWRGDFTAARNHLELALTLYREDQHARQIALFGEDAGITAQSYLSWVHSALGHQEPARQHSAAAVSLARRFGHPFSLGYALTFEAILACQQKDLSRAELVAQESRQLARRYGFPLWELGAQVVLGWVDAMHGKPEGAEAIQMARQAASQTMSGISVQVLLLLVEAQLALGQYAHAQTTAAEALALGKVIGDFHGEANLLRMQGLALLKQAPSNERAAQDCFRQALAMARQQQARQLVCELERVMAPPPPARVPTP